MVAIQAERGPRADRVDPGAAQHQQDNEVPVASEMLRSLGRRAQAPERAGGRARSSSASIAQLAAPTTLAGCRPLIFLRGQTSRQSLVSRCLLDGEAYASANGSMMKPDRPRGMVDTKLKGWIEG